MAICVWLAHRSETEQLPVLVRVVAGVFRVVQHKFKHHTQINNVLYGPFLFPRHVWGSVHSALLKMHWSATVY